MELGFVAAPGASGSGFGSPAWFLAASDQGQDLLGARECNILLLFVKFPARHVVFGLESGILDGRHCGWLFRSVPYLVLLFGSNASSERLTMVGCHPHTLVFDHSGDPAALRARNSFQIVAQKPVIEVFPTHRRGLLAFQAQSHADPGFFYTHIQERF